MLTIDVFGIAAPRPAQGTALTGGRGGDLTADAGGMDLFRDTLRSLASDNRPVLSPPKVPAVGSVGDDNGTAGGIGTDGASQALAVRQASPVSLPFGLLHHQEQRITEMVARARQTGDMGLALKASVAMGDQAVRFDIAAKAIGKTVSAIDQLTKLN